MHLDFVLDFFQNFLQFEFFCGMFVAFVFLVFSRHFYLIFLSLMNCEFRSLFLIRDFFVPIYFLIVSCALNSFSCRIVNLALLLAFFFTERRTFDRPQYML